MAGLTPLCPDHDHHTAVEKTGGDEPRLAVIEAVVDDRRRQSGEELSGAGEIEPAVLQGEIAFRRIERDRHNYCTPKKLIGQREGHCGFAAQLAT